MDVAKAVTGDRKGDNPLVARANGETRGQDLNCLSRAQKSMMNRPRDQGLLV